MAGNTAFWCRKALVFPQRRKRIVPLLPILTGQGIKAPAKLQGQPVEALRRFEKCCEMRALISAFQIQQLLEDV
jgi:hypothetical protein